MHIKKFESVFVAFSLWLGLSTSRSWAADYYVSQNGVAPFTVTNTVAGFNARTNGIGSDDTVHLVGVISKGIILFPGVHLLFDPDAKISNQTWIGGNNGINEPISGQNLSGVVIDGGVNGIIEATANGCGLAFTNLYNAVDVQVAGDIEIKNLTVTNIMQRNNTFGDSVSCQGIVVGGYMTNVLIHNNWIEMVGNAVIIASSGYCTNVQVYSNRMERCSWGCFVNTGDPLFRGYGFQIWANRMDHFDAWDTPAGTSGSLHQDGIYPNIHPYTTIVYDGTAPTATYDVTGHWNSPVNAGARYIWRPLSPNDISLLDGTNVISTWASFGTVTNTVTLTGIPGRPVTANLVYVYGGTNYGMKIYRNFIGPKLGVNMSAPIFLAPDFYYGLPNAMVYDNILVAGPGQGSGNGFVTMTCDGLVANNTFISQYSSNPAGIMLNLNGSRIKVYNNLCYNLANALFMNQFNVSPGFAPYSLAAADNNIYYRLIEWELGQGPWPRLYASGGYNRPAFEGHSTIAQPLLGPNFAPLSSDGVARGMGKNLSNYFTDDFNGMTRPPTGPWTIGAYEVSITRAAIGAPSSLRVTAN